MTPARGWVLLATDTGVGKTTLGTALARELTQRGQRIAVRKPVETGCASHQGQLHPADGTALWQAAGEIERLTTVCPRRFIAPLAAPEAARHEHQTLYFATDFAPNLPPLAHSTADAWLIESAGGLCSPIAEDALNIDLAAHTALPIILIAPDRLGTLSALFSALMALHARAVSIAAIVLNQTAPPAPDAPDNAASLQQWLPRLWPAATPRIVQIPWQSDQIGTLITQALMPD